MKFFFILLILLFLITCKSHDKPIIEEPKLTDPPPKRGLHYTVPEGMEEVPDLAYNYRYDNMIIDKGGSYEESAILIIIRHGRPNEQELLEIFVERDQKSLQSQVGIIYDEAWTPSGFLEKKLDYIAYQFYYSLKKQVYYQRTIYILFEDKVYIISLVSKYKNFILNNKSNTFWESVFVD
jgi:hypothetical protein